MSLEEIKQGLLSGEIVGSTLVWRKGMEQWQPLQAVEELRSLLGAPATTPTPAAPTAPPPSDTTQHRPAPSVKGAPAKARGAIAAWFGKMFGRMAEEIGSAIVQAFVNKPATTLVVVSTIVGGSTVVIVNTINKQSSKPVAAVTGQVRIDANPWGEVQWIRESDGDRVPLPEVRTTPLVMDLPVGAYEAEVEYPHASATKRCNLTVQENQTATCWLDLAPVDAKAYLERIGW